MTCIMLFHNLFASHWHHLLSGHTTKLNDLLQLLDSGDADAVRNELIEHSCERLRLLAAKILNRYPKVRRWEQTDDVFIEAATRLHASLEKFRPESARHFYNLAAQKIRFVLIDMARRHFGPLGYGKNHDSGEYEKTIEPQSPIEWMILHEAIEGLPKDAQEVFNLTLYDGCTQEEVSELLGVSVRTVKRRVQTAKLLLFEALRDE